MLRVKQGDCDAFEELVEKYKQPVDGFAEARRGGEPGLLHQRAETLRAAQKRGVGRRVLQRE